MTAHPDLSRALASGGPVLADGGVETFVVYDSDVDLPELQTIAMVGDPAGRAVLASLFGAYLDTAHRHRVPAVVGSPSWRGGRDRITTAGRPAHDLRPLNDAAVTFQRGLVDDRCAADPDWSAWVAGVMGPRGDGYDPRGALGVEDARAYHAEQAEVLAEAGADLLFGVPLPAADEAVGMGRAMAATGRPWVPSFLVGPDGHLPDGSRLVDVVHRLHDEVDVAPSHVSISCVHPTVVLAAHRATSATMLERDAWSRVQELKANGSALPPATLDAEHRLVCDPPDQWADAMLRARDEVDLAIVGGCCGTGPEHIEALAARLVGP